MEGVVTRVVKKHAVRRSEILDVAQRLVHTKGYEQMTVQDILDALQIAKGTFFYYFSSKQALLEALIERMLEEADHLLTPIVSDPAMPALEKLQRFFETGVRWKTAQKRFFLALLRVWYADENALTRQKVTAAGFTQLTPMLTAILRQGIQEGVFTTSYPDLAGEVVLSLMQGLGDSYSRTLLSFEPDGGDLVRLERMVGAYTDALERALGAPGGSLTLIDAETIREWVVPDGSAASKGVVS